MEADDELNNDDEELNADDENLDTDEEDLETDEEELDTDDEEPGTDNEKNTKKAIGIKDEEELDSESKYQNQGKDQDLDNSKKDQPSSIGKNKRSEKQQIRRRGASDVNEPINNNVIENLSEDKKHTYETYDKK